MEVRPRRNTANPNGTWRRRMSQEKSLSKSVGNERLCKQSLLTLCNEQEAMANRLVLVLAATEDRIWDMLESQAKMLRNLDKAETENRRMTEELAKMKNNEKTMGDRIQELEKYVEELASFEKEWENKLEETQAKEKASTEEVARLNVKVLYPDSDLSPMGCFKEIVDGRIGDKEEDEIEQEENENEAEVGENDPYDRALLDGKTCLLK
ncbi:hypothetical protein VNO78_12247 [Psophocarpus tetragonolobus]|uniref:Uncharacterized protein n=1 Tax=Psophocarpus tetragonolobus TaxID=3891 RepID=A0AAN9SNS3_PSOTE